MDDNRSKVCIVGASGKLGQYMVQHALDRGYEVVGVCRQQSVGKLDAFKERITIVPGETNDREVIKRAVDGCDGVLTVLVPRGVHGYSTGTAQAVLDYAPRRARLVFSCGWHITLDGQDVYSLKLKALVKIGGPLAQFRITGWPGLLPHPPCGNSLTWALSEDGVLAAAIGAWLMLHDVPDLEVVPLLGAEAHDHDFDKGDADEISAVGEIYLELINLDLEEDEAIYRFVRRFGVLGVAHEQFALFRSLPGFAAAILPALAAAWPAERFNQMAENYLERRGDGLNTNLVETLEEFRFGARVLRDLVTAARISQLDEPPVAVRWESIPEEAMNEKRADLADYGIEFDAQEEAVEIFLRQILTDGLRPFHPRVVYVDGEAADEFRAAPLYAVCCLELFNHMVEAAQVRVCANDSCRRPFVRQRGRAEHGQHRVRGVKYCSSHCARAQAQRVYRRRLASSRNTDLS